LNSGSEPNSFRLPIVFEEGGEEEDEEEDAQDEAQVEIPPKRIAGEGAENAGEIAAQRRHRHPREVKPQPPRRHLQTVTRKQMKPG